MKLRLQGGLLLLFVTIGIPPSLAANEELVTVRDTPQPRPRLTEALRAKAEIAREGTASNGAVTMPKVVVRETRLPSGPPKEQQRDGEFTITQGGYVVKDRGERFSTELGLWRHIDIMDEPTDALRQTTRIRMSFLRFSW